MKDRRMHLKCTCTWFANTFLKTILNFRDESFSARFVLSSLMARQALNCMGISISAQSPRYAVCKHSPSVKTLDDMLVKPACILSL